MRSCTRRTDPRTEIYRRIRASADFVPALGTELRAGFEMRAAATALGLGCQRLAAFGTELRAPGARSAAGTEGRRFRGEVHALGEVLLLKVLLHLLDLGVDLCGGEFRLDVGSAVVAEHALLVPAG